MRLGAVEGFAKECAVVTHYRLKNGPNGNGVVGWILMPVLRRAYRASTSKPLYGELIRTGFTATVICLCCATSEPNVMRWEMRSTHVPCFAEFLWQEGHCAYATAEESEARTVQMINLYADFAEEYMAVLPLSKGVKSGNERFAGALNTYTIEAMMQDGKALRSGIIPHSTLGRISQRHSM